MDRGPASTSLEERADRNTLPKHPTTCMYIISELLRWHEIIDVDRYRYVTYVRCYAENVAKERDFSQDCSLLTQQPVRSLFVLQRLASKHMQV